MSDQLLLSEAAKLVTKAPATLRRLVNDGKIPSTKDNQGRNRVLRNDVLAFYATSSDRHSIESRLYPVMADPLVKSMIDQITLLKEALDRERNEKDEIRKQNLDLQIELVKLIVEMKAILNKEGGNLLSRWIRK